MSMSAILGPIPMPGIGATLVLTTHLWVEKLATSNISVLSTVFGSHSPHIHYSYVN